MIEATDIALVLRAPAGIFIEDGCMPLVQSRGLAVSVRTDTAFRLPIAAICAAALQERLNLRQEVADAIELALHEGIANAVIHGNLGVSSKGRSNIVDYGHFCALLDARLQDPVAAARAIRVTARWNQAKVLLAISDEGNGFTPQISSNSSEAASGRGLALVRALASSVRWNQRHRSLILTFDTTRQTGA